MVAHHLGADHGHGLGLGRVDLARHNRGAGLVGWKQQLAQATTRAAAERADVIGDLHQRDGNDVERARGLDDGVVRRQRFELVVCGDERQAGDLGHLGGEGLGEALRRVEPRAHRGAALGQLYSICLA